MAHTALLVIDSEFRWLGSLEGSEGIRSMYTSSGVGSDDMRDLGGESLAKAPWLSRENLTQGKILNGGLVRYRCMVQDSLDPEYYVERYLIKECATGKTFEKSAKYLENLPPCPEGFDICTCSLSNAGTAERLPFFAVPIPAETPWTTKDPIVAPASSKKRSFRKRSLDNVAQLEPIEAPVADKENVSNPKRVQQEKVEPKAEMPMSSEQNHVRHLEMWKPLKEDTGTCCIIKVYNSSAIKVKLNDIVEVVGVISVSGTEDPTGTQEIDRDAAFKEFVRFEEYGKSPPMSLVPRIHCVEIKVLDASKSLEVYSAILKNHSVLSRTKYMETRALTIDFLLPVVGGDRLSAEYLFIWLVSGVFERQPSGGILGKFSLALTQFGLDCPSASTILYTALCLLLPRCNYFPLTMNMLNGERFSPYKDYKYNRLCSGRLQVCNNTLFVVDETRMNTGKLDAVGLENLNALSQLTRDQTITYDFQFHKTEWNVNLPVLVLSNARKPLISGFDCDCPVIPATKYGDPPQVFSQDKLNAIRAYLATVQSSVMHAFDISEDACTRVEDFYVRRRQQTEKASQADLNRWLCMARFWELSMGSNELSEDGWKSVQRLELERSSRKLSLN